MDTRNMEYQTAVKDYEQIVLDYGYNEILRSWEKKDDDIAAQTKNGFKIGSEI